MTAKLLLAEDSLTIQKVFELTFKQSDISITTVDNGDDAVRLAREISPDLVVADVSLPGKDGFEVSTELQSAGEGTSCPVLILAGTLAPFDEEKFKKSGARGVLFKPFESQDLIDKVEALLHSPEKPSLETEEKERALAAGEEPWDFSDVLKELEDETVAVSGSRPAGADDVPAMGAVPVGDSDTTLSLEDFDVSLEDIEKGRDSEPDIRETEFLSTEEPGELALEPDLPMGEEAVEIAPEADLLEPDETVEIAPEPELLTPEEPAEIAPGPDLPAPEEPAEAAPSEDVPAETLLSEEQVEGPAFDDSPQPVTDLGPAFEMVQELESVRELEDVGLLEKTAPTPVESTVPPPEEDEAVPPPHVPEASASGEAPEETTSPPATEPLPGERELRELFSVRAQEIFEKVAAETVEKVMWETMENLTKEFTEKIRESVEAVAWEVVPATTEAIIREEIARIREESGKESS